MNRILWIVGIAALLFPVPGNAIEKISLTQPVTCKFQYGQYMDSQKAETDTQKSVLEWNFFNLLGSRPHFLAGGDTGSISVHRHETSDGVSIWLTQGNGAHLFSIWPHGRLFGVNTTTYSVLRRRSSSVVPARILEGLIN